MPWTERTARKGGGSATRAAGVWVAGTRSPAPSAPSARWVSRWSCDAVQSPPIWARVSIWCLLLFGRRCRNLSRQEIERFQPVFRDIARSLQVNSKRADITRLRLVGNSFLLCAMVG